MPIFAANIHFLFNELDFLDRFEAAARLGFRGVEYQFPYGRDLEPIKRKLRDCELSMVLINLPAGDRLAGDRGIACVPGREAEFQDSVELGLQHARELGCAKVNCLAGVVREGTSKLNWYKTLVDNLGYAAERFAPYGINVMLEPMNLHDVPGYCVSTSADARAVIEEVGAPNLRLQYDVYHMQIMEGNLTRNIEDHADVIGHVQIADNPGRHEPGTGEISFSFIFDLLDRVEYSGWISCEYTPSAATADSFEWVKPYLFPRPLPIDD